MGMQLRHGEAACTRHAAWTWTCNMDMDMQHAMNTDKQHVRTCSCWMFMSILQVMFMLHVHVHAPYPSICSVSMSKLYAHVHAACPCLSCMPMSMLRVHPCLQYATCGICTSDPRNRVDIWCMSMSMLHVHARVHAEDGRGQSKDKDWSSSLQNLGSSAYDNLLIYFVHKSANCCLSTNLAD